MLFSLSPQTTSLKSASLMLAVIATAVALSASPLRAQEGFYGSLHTGAAILGNMNNDSAASRAGVARDLSHPSLALDLNTGWTVGAAVGYRFAQPFRAELSIDYLDGSLKGRYVEQGFFVPCGTFANQPCLGPAVKGDIKAWSGFAMGYYDIDLGAPITPYVGAGAGLVRSGLDVETTARLNVGTSNQFDIIDDHDTELGYRLAAGLAYNMGTATVDVGYTYTITQRPGYAGNGSGIPSFTYRERLDSHAVKAGVRFGF
jgi:opacity protein-like surface antigen